MSDTSPHPICGDLDERMTKLQAQFEDLHTVVMAMHAERGQIAARLDALLTARQPEKRGVEALEETERKMGGDACPHCGATR